MTVAFRRKLIWVTRTSPYATRSAQRLTHLGFRALALPVLQVRSVDWRRLDHQPNAIVFTSAHGVRLHRRKQDWSELPVFAVGDHTAREASAIGYRNVRSAVGDVEALKKLIATTLPRPARLAIFGASEPAGDLRDYLERSGYWPESCVVYETRPSSDEELHSGIELLPQMDGITAYSPKAARRLAQIIQQSRWQGPIFCISRAVASDFAQCEGVSVHIAEKPNEHAMLQLVIRHWAAPGIHAASPARSFSTSSHATSALIANDNAIGVHGQTATQGAVLDDDDPPPPSAA